MGREIRIVWAGRHHRRGWEELCSDYRRRLARHWTVRDMPVKVGPSGGRRRAEAEALLAVLPDPCWSIALDGDGEPVTSEGLATLLLRLQEEWPHPVAFLVGSDRGHDPLLLGAVRQCISFGPLTLPHELARLVLYEQLYRALTIQRGIKYHRR